LFLRTLFKETSMASSAPTPTREMTSAAGQGAPGPGDGRAVTPSSGEIVWYQATAEDVARRLGSHMHDGLTPDAAAQRLAEVGPNELVERGGRTRWQILLEQFSNILTLLLIAAAIISYFLGDVVEAVVILAIVVLNGVLGFTQEYRAEQSMAALKRMSVPTVRVRRGGQIREISAREVVPGDVVILETGNVVPADGRITLSINLRAMEAALTGESEAVEKDPDLVFAEDRPLGDRKNMIYSGTVVNYGRGEMIVTGTGMNTELGRIAELLQSVVDEETPLQQRLNRLGTWLAVAAIVLVVVIFLGGLALGQPIESMLLTAVSLAVAAIPEALTAVVTIALSLGAQRMLRRKALIRQLPAVETLGSVTVICSDKTGTLTQNRMTVTALDVADRRLEFRQREDAEGLRLVRVSPDNAGDDATPEPELLPSLDLLLVSGALNNDAQLVRSPVEPNAEETAPPGGHFHAVGDPTEGALVLAAAEYGVLKPELDATFPRVAELPFDSVRKRMTTVHRVPQSNAEIPDSLCTFWERRPQVADATRYVAFTKGAIDGLLRVSSHVWMEDEAVPLDDGWRRRILASHDELAAQGMRVLGMAVRTLEEQPTKQEMEQIEEGLTLVGLYAMMDPPRQEVRAAVLDTRTAGIRPVMITGDHPLTARHIAQQVGITDSADAPFLTGQELDQLSPEELRARARDVQVFARVSPEHKLTLIEIYQEQGHIVAMTGDGVNDAPALKRADIGVAMGITGTDVSKEAAQMVLLDDNFATIVAAVEEGRVVYDNIRKFIKYLLSCNASEIVAMLIWPLAVWLAGIQFGPDSAVALLPLQILWMNLVTDGLPALALGVEPAEANVMKRPPFSSQESIFGRGMVPFIIFFGIFMALVAVGVGLWAKATGDPAWQTLLFTTLIFNQVVLALGVRSEDQPLWRIGFFSNRSMVIAFLTTLALQMAVIYLPFMQQIFNTKPLGLRDLLIAFGIALITLVAVELWKLTFARRASKR
jgi:Ca2+-transporting ATPase